jgi:hypothetical protein
MPEIECFYEIEVFYIKCYDIDYSTFDMNVTSFDIIVAKKTFNIGEIMILTLKSLIFLF